MDFNKADTGHIDDRDRQRILRRFGLTPSALVAVGTEAEVYAYDATALLKLYADASRYQHFETLRQLYDSVDTSKSGLNLPRIHDVIQDGDLVVVIERRLAGSRWRTG